MSDLSPATWTIDHVPDWRGIVPVARRTVIDVGGFAGAQAKSALDGGAARGVCLDSGQYVHYKWTPPSHQVGVEYVTGDVMAWTEPFDVVVCWNVIYHQRNPWAFAEKLRALTREALVLHTSFVLGDEPNWRVYRPYEGHAVSWTVAWRPTVAGLVNLLAAVGFVNIVEFCRSGDHVGVIAYPGEIPGPDQSTRLGG